MNVGRGKSQNNGLVAGALFFSSPRLALRTRFAHRAKCRVCFARLIKRLLCRLGLAVRGLPVENDLLAITSA